MRHTISIRTNILSIFLFLILLIVGLVLSVHYYYNSKLASSAAQNQFEQLAGRLEERILALDEQMVSLIHTSELFPGLESAIAFENLHPSMVFFTNALKYQPNLHSLMLGHPSGDYYQVINMQSDPILYTAFNVPKVKGPKQIRWAIIKVVGNDGMRKRYLEFVDDLLDTRLMREEATTFDPRYAFWYKKAYESERMIKTEPYLFEEYNSLGVGYAKRLENGIVLAADISLNNLSEYVSRQTFSPDNEIFLFDGAGRKILSSDTESFLQPDRLMKAKPDEIYHFVFEGTGYMGYVRKLPSSLGVDEYLGITVPEATIRDAYMETVSLSLYITTALVLLSIPLVLYSTGRIVQPIKALIHENEKVRKRHFDEVNEVKTDISECRDLSRSMVSMAHDIKAFQISQQRLMDAFFELIGGAIDAKSHHTGGHCKRVPDLALMLAEEANKATHGPFREFRLENDEEWRELRVGALLHDCGKITTPEYVIDKSSKLETIYNRIHEIRTRFEVIWRDLEIEYYQRKESGEDVTALDTWLESEKESLIKDFTFIAGCNLGQEKMDENKLVEIRRIAARTWVRHFDNRMGLPDAELTRYESIPAQPLPALENLLSDKPEHIVKRFNFDYEKYKSSGFKEEVPENLYNYGEIYNLSVRKGTLTAEERFKIDEHVIMSIEMLEQLPLPRHLHHVPEYAGTHHETLDGTGYPRGLTKEDLSIPARIMAIADVFEALTAADRPYKKPKTLSETLLIMENMALKQHIDPDIFELFVHQGVHKKYANKHLSPEQIDL